MQDEEDGAKTSKNANLSTIYWSLCNIEGDKYYIKWQNNEATKRYLNDSVNLVESEKEEEGTVWIIKK